MERKIETIQVGAKLESRHSQARLEKGYLDGTPEVYTIPQERWNRIQSMLTSEQFNSISFRGHGYLALSKMSKYEVDFEGQRLLQLSEEIHMLTMATDDMKDYEDAVVLPWGRANADLCWREWDWGYSVKIHIPIFSPTGKFMEEVMEGRKFESYGVNIDRGGVIRSVIAAEEDVTELLRGTKDRGERFLIEPILEFTEHALEKMRVTGKYKSSESIRER